MLILVIILKKTYGESLLAYEQVEENLQFSFLSQDNQIWTNDIGQNWVKSIFFDQFK